MSADLLERRWTVSILVASQEGAIRFNEFLQMLGSVPPATLASRLVRARDGRRARARRDRRAPAAGRVPPHRPGTAARHGDRRPPGLRPRRVGAPSRGRPSRPRALRPGRPAGTRGAGRSTTGRAPAPAASGPAGVIVCVDGGQRGTRRAAADRRRVGRGAERRALRGDRPRDRRGRRLGAERRLAPTSRPRSTPPRRRSSRGSSLAAIERARILRRSADLLRERKEAIAAVMTAEQGKPLAEAAGEIGVRGELLRVVRGRGRAGLRPARARPGPAEPGARAAPARRCGRRDHALELPGRDDDAQARAGDGGRLHEHRQAGQRDPAHRRARAAHDRGCRARRRASST